MTNRLAHATSPYLLQHAENPVDWWEFCPEAFEEALTGGLMQCLREDRPRIASGEVITSFALTEPEHGSDAVGLETSARRDGDSFVLNGREKWIGNGSIADHVIPRAPRTVVAPPVVPSFEELWPEDAASVGGIAGSTVGGGSPTLTGPAFIDKSNIDAVAVVAMAQPRRVILRSPGA